jgi:acyl carrier protein
VRLSAKDKKGNALGDDLQTIADIIRALFDEYEGPVTRDLSARDVAQWDSLANVQFAVLVERAFGIRFETREIGRFKNIAELLDLVAAKRTRQ